jgi:hypothetical protein
MSSGRGRTYTYTPDTAIEDAAAGRARELWARYESAYLPKLIELTNSLESGDEEINRAENTARGAVDRSVVGMNQTLAMYGNQMNPMQREAMRAKLAAGKTLAAVDARNKARRGVADRRGWLEENLVAEGAGIRGESNAALNNAAALEMQRNQTGYGIAAQRTAASQARAQAGLAFAGQVIGTGATIAALS